MRLKVFYVLMSLAALTNVYVARAQYYYGSDPYLRYYYNSYYPYYRSYYASYGGRGYMGAAGRMTMNPMMSFLGGAGAGGLLGAGAGGLFGALFGGLLGKKG
ncbi:hypothetical protein AAVH_27078 [Aphelenchoides avenae]|nr:hypothetical protein AAVH_27078 [Aphelenchus avenae]